MKRTWTWRVDHPELPIYLEGNEFWPAEARDEGLKARARMACAYDGWNAKDFKLKVTGPMGGVHRWVSVLATKSAGRWMRVRK